VTAEELSNHRKPPTPPTQLPHSSPILPPSHPPGTGSSLRAAVSTVDGGGAMCSLGGVSGEVVWTGRSSDWRVPSTWVWEGVVWERTITKY